MREWATTHLSDHVHAALRRARLLARHELEERRREGRLERLLLEGQGHGLALRAVPGDEVVDAGQRLAAPLGGEAGAHTGFEPGGAGRLGDGAVGCWFSSGLS